ncbi:MAG TPA: VWA domain-containing protein [Terriglobales bacterium]|nr:VWA domain-containing protein [Terriglobales bacterium]
MAKRCFLFFCLFLGPCCGSWTEAQDTEPHIRVVVNLVQLNVAVTDSKGNYVTGLPPQAFSITEDGIRQNIATFAEGNEVTRTLIENAAAASNPEAAPVPAPTGPTSQVSGGNLGSQVAGANVFILFDTSNYMYRGFVFAQDAIADFIRSLESADKLAFYSYSRDLSRSAPLTSDRSAVLRGVRSTVAGDDAALYNCLLLTIRDAAQYTGRKVVVVFSNGPDNSSVVPPEDVAELAQSTGTAVYMISTQQAKLEPISTAVFERMTAATGGKAYFAKNWKDEHLAFTSIRDDLAHLYSLSYYPQPNPNLGWRTITVKLVGEHAKKFHIRTRNGYRPQPTRFSNSSISSELPPANAPRGESR